MSNKPNKKHREQAADLLLLSPEGSHMVFSSAITTNKDSSMSFEVRQPVADGDRYRVTVKIEEI